MKSRVLVAALALGALACGDPETEDRRGYSKAPLENPGLLIEGENATAMAALNRTNLPRPSTEFEQPAESTGDAEGSAAGGAAQAEVTLAQGVTQEQYDQGRDVFAGQGGCQACHGPNGTGSTLGPNLSDEQWLHVSGPIPEEIAGVIRSGVPQPRQFPAPMPPMGGANLDDQQIQALAGYVASLSQG